MIEKFQKVRFAETENLVNLYKKICNKNEIQAEDLYIESDSVRKGLVDAISKFDITKLVLGTSKNDLSSDRASSAKPSRWRWDASRIRRALKVESISTYVTKHAPKFCEVLVVNKEKLPSPPTETRASALACSSPSSHWRSDEDDSRTGNGIESGERVTHDTNIIEISATPTSPHADKNGLVGRNMSSVNDSGQSDHECIVQRRLAKEVERHQKTQMELETQKRMATKQAETERSSCEEDLNRKLKIERMLREEAEKKALEANAKVLELQKYTEYGYEELQSATNGFDEANKLGKGGYGPVYVGKLRHTSVAIKVLARDTPRGREEFQREVEVLSRIHHPHILLLLGVCSEKGCIAYEYMANGSVDDRINCKDGTPPLPWYARCRISFELATALCCLHSQHPPIVHRDLKLANILLDRHFVSKLGDVGMAKQVPENLTFSETMYRDSEIVGTFGYIDPDYQRTGVVSCESDVYSLGIVMLQLLTGKRAVGVAHFVEAALTKGKLEEVLDKSAGEWPIEEAKKLARLSLKCTEYRRPDRPKLEMDILPVLESIKNVAEAANMANVCQMHF